MQDNEERLSIVIRNLQEFIGVDKLKECLEKTGIFNVYWGTAPTGRPHIAYFVPMTKIGDLLKAGCDVTILFANLHAYLDNMKAPWELLQKRTEYYEVLIKGMLKALKVPLDKLHFVRGTEHQLKENYTANVYQIIGITTAHDAAKAGCEVVKQTSDPYISGIIYPLLQALDEEFLGVDAQFGGVDQRKIFTYAEKYLPNLGFAKRAHLMNPMIPGLTGGKMSASEENSKIDLLDNKETVAKKLRHANCSEPTAQTNGLLAFIKHVILPIKTQLGLASLDKYETVEEIESDLATKSIDEDMLKKILEDALCLLMSNLADEFRLAGKPNLDQEAYPSDVVESLPESKETTESIMDFPVHLQALVSEFPDITKVPIDQFPGIVDHQPTVLWSVRASGEPHVGYLVPLRRLAKLSNSDWKVVIMIEDIGAHLHSHHNLNRPAWNLLKHRAALYREVFERTFTKLFHGNRANLLIVIGSEFQLSRDYALLMYQTFSKMTERECNEMITKIVGNQSETITSLSSVVYPCIQALDQMFLRATVRLMGDYPHVEDFRTFGAKVGSRLHLEKRVPVLVTHDMILALNGEGTMKSPRIGTKTAPKDTTSISMCDSLEVVNRKMKKAFFDPKQLDRDPSLIIIEKIIWPCLQNNNRDKGDLHGFKVTRSEENGGNVSFTSIADISHQLTNDLMHPGDVKLALCEYLTKMFLDPINVVNRDECQSVDIISRLFTSAYPAERKRVKINKKAYNPNRLDLRIALVESIVFERGSFTILLQCGTKQFSLKAADRCYSLTPNDLCIVAIRPSHENSDAKLLGILCGQQQLSNKGSNTTAESGSKQSNMVPPITLQLVKNKNNTSSCASGVTFELYDPVCPHLKETNEMTVWAQIEENLVVDQSGQLVWGKDNLCAVGVEIKCDLIQNMKVILDKF